MLPRNVSKVNDGHYGSLLPYELSCKHPHAVVGILYFRISQRDFFRLEDDYYGQGKCYAWCEKAEHWYQINVYKWRVTRYIVIHDPKILKEIEEEYLS